MAAARYWRVTGIKTVAGGSMELSTLHLYAGGARVDAAATLSCSHSPTAGTLANLRDGDAATLCSFAADAVRSGGFHLAFDAGTATEVDALRLGSGGQEGTFISELDLAYSIDGVSWVAAGVLGQFIYPGATALQPAPSREGDAKFAQVVALLHCDGAVGAATSAVDSSSAARTITVSGAVEYATSGALAGTAFLFPGSAGALVDIAPGTDLVFGTGDFAIEGTYSYDTSGSAATSVPWHFGSYGVSDTGYSLFMSKAGGSLKVGVVGLASNDVFDVCYVVVSPSLVDKLPIKVQRRAGTVELYFSGELVASASSTLNISKQQKFVLGALNNSGSSSYSATYAFKGQIDEFRVTADNRGAGDYVPSAGAFPDTAAGGGALYNPRSKNTLGSRAVVSAVSPISDFSCIGVADLQMCCDVQYGGSGTIYGTTKNKGTPNTPTKARVVLLHQRSKQLVRETWSNPVTGYFEFAGIDPAQQFLTLAEDAAGNFRPVAASRLTPEVPA